MNEDTTNRTTRTRWILALAGSGIFLAGLLVGMLSGGGSLFAFAASPSSHATTQHAAAQASKTPVLSPQDAARYCQLYEQTITSETGISAAALEQANYDALVKVLDQMVADGKMTAAQEAQIKVQLDQLKSAPCQHLGQLGQGGQGTAPTGAQQQALTNARGSIVAAVATTLHLTPAALQSDLTSGQTIPAIAAAQHVALDTVNQAYLAAVQGQLAQAVKGGLITQAQADHVSAMIQSMVAAGHYPLLERGFGA